MLKRTHIIRGIGVIQIIMALLICCLAIKARSDISPVLTQLEKVFASADKTLEEHRRSYTFSVDSALKLAEPMEFWGNSIKDLGKIMDKIPKPKIMDRIRNINLLQNFNISENMEKTGDAIIQQAKIMKDYGENGYKTTLCSFDETAKLLKTCNGTINDIARQSSYYCLICTIASFLLLANGIALCLLGNQ